MTQSLTTKLKKFIQLMKESEEQAQRGFELLLKRDDFDEFFDHLNSAGLFGKEHNRGPAPADQPGQVYIPFWSALSYLEAIAKRAGERNNLQLAEKVMDVVRTVSSASEAGGTIPDNYHTHRIFAKILGLVPTSVVTETDIDLVPGWLLGKFDRSMVGHALDTGVMRRFLESDSSNDWNKACNVFYHCTAVLWLDEPELGKNRKKPVTVVEDHRLKEMIKHHAKDLGIRVGKRATEILVERLRETYDQEHRNLPSWLIRPAVEDHTQNHEWRGPENRFVEGLRDVLLSWIDHDLLSAKPFVRELLHDNAAIIRRIGIYVLNQRWEKLKDLFASLLNHQLLLAEHLHEVYSLLHHQFEKFTEGEKEAVVELIRQLQPLSEEDRERRLKFAQRNWLSAIAGKGYESAESWFNSLLSDQEIGGVLEHPDFHSYMEHWVGPGPSAYKSQELLGFAEHGSIVEMLNDFRQKDAWRGPTTKALVDSLEEAVVLAPQTFLRLLPAFIDAKRPFQYGLIEGFKRLWMRNEKGQQPIDWDLTWKELIRFFEQIIGPPGFWTEQLEEDDHNLTPNRDWIPPIIADFIKSGTLDDENAYPPDMLPKTWGLLRILLERLEMEKQAPQSDAIDHVINLPRGKAIETLFIHTLRECRISDKAGKGHASTWTMRKAAFDAELVNCKNSNFEFSTLAGNYIANLDYLDPAWLRDNIESIFPRDFRDNFRCALDGLAHATVTDAIYAQLVGKEVIDLALRDQLAEGRARERLIERIALAYLRGHEELDSGRFSYLFQSENLEGLENVSGWFWSIRKEPLTSEHLSRILQFLDKCISWSHSLSPPPAKLLSNLSRLSFYVNTLSKKETDWLLAVAPYVNVGYNTDFFLEELDRLADLYATEVSLVMNAFLSAYVPNYDFEDRLKSILEKLSQRNKREDAMAFAEKLRGLPGMIQLYEELRKGNGSL